MICILSNTTNPYYNFAYEEYLLSKFEENILFLYRNSESIIIGRNQILPREINNKLVYQSKIPVIRRNSGGGTVYNDPGNINLAFITQRKKNLPRLFGKLIVRFFLRNGLSLQHEDNGSLFHNKQKISGSAQYYRKNRAIHHATLLLNTNLEKLNDFLLNKNYYRYNAKSQTSKKTQVININDIASIKEADLIQYLSENIETIKLEDFVDIYAEDINKIVSKFKNSKWLNKQPNYTFKNNFNYMNKKIRISFDVKNNIIANYECNDLYFSQKYNLNGIMHYYNCIKSHPVNKEIIEYIF